MTHSVADWLVLAYLAADNDLEGELLTDLAEMERVGSRPGVVDVLAQIDRPDVRARIVREVRQEFEGKVIWGEDLMRLMLTKQGLATSDG